MARRYERMTNVQLEIMVDYFSKYPDLVSGKLSSSLTKEERNQKWEELSVLLNSTDLGATRDHIRWKKCWADVKCNLRSKAARINVYKRCAGAGPASPEKFTSIEERILKIIGSSSSVAVKRVEENGFGSLKETDDLCVLPKCDKRVTEVHSTPLSLKRKSENSIDSPECDEGITQTHSTPSILKVKKQAINPVTIEFLFYEVKKQSATLEKIQTNLERLNANFEKFTKAFLNVIKK